MRKLEQDLRYALRMLIKGRGVTLIALLTLTLGIGANTAIFSVVNAVLLRPLPYPDAERLYLLFEHWPQFPTLSVSYQNYVDWKQQSKAFEDMGAYHDQSATLIGQGAPERVTERMVTANLLPMLGARPQVRRLILPEDDQTGATAVAVLSHTLWEQRFGESPAVVGKTVTLDNQPYTVVGVLPREFRFLQSADVYLAFAPWAKTLPDDRSWHPGINPVGRLRRGLTASQAQAEMDTIASRLEKQYPDFDTNVGARVAQLQTQMVKDVRSALLILLAAVGAVLLIACANVANLQLARATARQKEFSIRAALGAGRGRLVRQLLTESTVLALAGGVLGIGLAGWMLKPLLRLAAGTVPRAEDIGINATVLIFSVMLAALTGILFGIAPALQTSRLDLCAGLNQMTRGNSGSRQHLRLRGMLVISEMALAMLLLVGAGLLIQSFVRLQTVQPGFRPGGLLLADVPLSTAAYANPAQRTVFFDQLLSRARALPGVRAAAMASSVPLTTAVASLHFNIAGRPPKSPHEYSVAGYRTVSPQYFETLGGPLLEGREFKEQDNATGAPVVVISATMKRQFFPDGRALGQHLQLGATPEKALPWMEVVGVVGDVNRDLATAPIAEMYIPYAQAIPDLPNFFMSVILRTDGDPLALAPALRTAVRQIDEGQPVIKVRTMEQQTSDSVAAPRFRTMLLGLLAGTALMLAAIGVYGVMSFAVAQRTHEIGVRMALGAGLRDVVWLVLRHGAMLAVSGVGAGAIAAVLLTRVMSKFLFGVTATDPVTFGGVGVVLVGVALLACYVPARRAMKVDPLVALRYE